MADVARISPKEAFEKMAEGYVYIDVRSEREFAEGHPAGAINVPLAHETDVGMEVNPDFLQVMTANFAKDTKIVLGCLAGGRSLRAAQQLATNGFTQLLDQRAGWQGTRDPFGQLEEVGWSQLDLPTEAGEPEGRCYRDLLQ
ncbi:MAG: rhodanese-like domain-containing protein [Myxococcales bacterium]|jgi:rhodanese-related sulfurtransferase